LAPALVIIWRHLCLTKAGHRPESEQDWAAQRHTVWKEEWQRHCFTFAVDDADQVKSITVFLVSSRQHRSSDTVQLWVDQADLFPAGAHPLQLTSVTRGAAIS
jgi:hypothetical protein